MIKTVFYRYGPDSYKYEYLSQNSQATVVAPHPALADDIRTRSSQSRPDLNLDILTIANFVKDEISRLELDLEIHRKSDLMLKLSTVWKSIFPNGHFEEFLQSFNIFTELRGFTIDPNMIEEVLGCFDKKVSQGVRIFWAYLQEQGIHEEHGVYALLTQKYCSKSAAHAANIIFRGFSHLSASQVDLLKALAEKHNVYIPFSLSIYNNARNSDWIKWITTEKVAAPDIKREKKPLPVLSSQKNRLGESLEYVLGQRKHDKHLDIILAQRNPTLGQIQEIPEGNISFSASVEIFKAPYTKIFDELKATAREGIQTSSILEWLKKILSEEKSKGFYKKDFKFIKTAQLIYEKIEEWENLSELNTTIRPFDCLLLQKVLELNLPRSTAAPMLFEQPQVSVKGLESLESITPDGRVILCVSSEHEDIGSTHEMFDENVMKYLVNIGPIKPNELETQIIKEKIVEILNYQESILIIEDEVRETSPLWSEVLSLFDVRKIDIQKKDEHLPKDHIKETPLKNIQPPMKWSAAKIQKYIDCPRSFYYHYVHPLHTEPKRTKSLEPRQLGTLEHKVIESYLTQKDNFDKDEHQDLTKEILLEFIQEKSLSLSSLEYEKSLVELINYSSNGIKTLLRLKEHYPEATFQFEIPFEKNGHRGRIDCLINLPGKVGILDFKRGGGGIPTLKKMLDFAKIQAWYYMNHLERPTEDIQFLGYLNLSEIKESLIVLNTDTDTQHFPSEICKVGKASFGSVAQDFKRFLIDKIDTIAKDQNFLPIPSEPLICQYCWLDKVCVKEQGLGQNIP